MAINVGEPVTVTAIFRVDDTPTTPTTTTITVKPPTGPVVIVSPLSGGTGVVNGVYTPLVDGIHWVRFEGTGAAAGIHEYRIYVHPRQVPIP